MGKILRQRLREDGVVAEVLLTREETRELGGEMEDVMLFTDAKPKVESRISLRGKYEATKYFLIPKQLRKSLNLRGSVSCYRVQRENKDVFVYVVNPDAERRSFIAEQG